MPDSIAFDLAAVRRAAAVVIAGLAMTITLLAVPAHADATQRHAGRWQHHTKSVKHTHRKHHKHHKHHKRHAKASKHRHQAQPTSTKKATRTSSERVPATPARTAFESSAAQAVLNELNSERADHNLPALRLNSHLLLSARRHNVLMAQDNTMSHQLRNEPVFTDREKAAGYRWQWAGENIGWNSDMTSSGAVYLEKIMYGEKPPQDGHRQNILNTHYRDIGVDVLVDDTNGKIWLTTDFGRI